MVYFKMASQTLLKLRENPIYSNFCKARDDPSNTVFMLEDLDVLFILDVADEDDKYFPEEEHTYGFYAYENPKSITFQTRMNPKGIQHCYVSQHYEKDRNEKFQLRLVSVQHTKKLSSKILYVTGDVKLL